MVQTSSDGITPDFAVLNDFDLAAIMEPGEEFPSKVGFERTGTMPFMAVDLLLQDTGMIKGLYAHDLESMIWCMVWYLEPQPDWTHGCMKKVGTLKLAAALLFKVKELSEWAVDNDAEGLWGSVIRILKEWIMSRPDEVEGTEATNNFTDHDHLRLFDKHMPYPKRAGKGGWDSRWTGWKLPNGDVAAVTETWKNKGKN
jgi:hypothetical protein